MRVRGSASDMNCPLQLWAGELLDPPITAIFRLELSYPSWKRENMGQFITVWVSLSRRWTHDPKLLEESGEKNCRKPGQMSHIDKIS